MTHPNPFPPKRAKRDLDKEPLFVAMYQAMEDLRPTRRPEPGEEFTCPLCKDVIRSMHRHDMVFCKCGQYAVDGGADYMKVSGPMRPVALRPIDGPDVTPDDAKRLVRLLDRVRDLMADGEWRTLSELHNTCGGSEASCSARLRDLRKAKHGAWTVDRRRRSAGTWEYRAVST